MQKPEESPESTDASTASVYRTTNGNDVLAIEIDDAGHLIFGVFDRSMAVSITLDRAKVRELRDSLSAELLINGRDAAQAIVIGRLSSLPHGQQERVIAQFDELSESQADTA